MGSDNSNNNGDNNNDKKIIEFPKTQRRKSLSKDKKQAQKEEIKHQKAQADLEEKYRSEYRAQRAKELSNMARQSASGDVPFINWHKVPIFTRSVLIVFLLIQIIMSFVISAPDKIMFMYYFGFVPAIYSGYDDWSWAAIISPITSLFIHAGWMHLIFNIVMMLAMGIFFERRFGAKLTAMFFFISGLAGNLVCFILSPESSVPVIGASGAISGLFAATFMMMTQSGLLGADAQRRGVLPFILIWSAIIIVFGMLSSDVSWQSHIGGFLCGAGLFQLLKKGDLPIK